MRHKKRGRTLGRSSSHRKAMRKNMTASLFLTRREIDEFDENPPKHPGRIVTTLQKAKEVRANVERCITIARKALEHERKAREFATDAERNSEEWKTWRKSEQWQKWAQARAPVVTAMRRVLKLVGDKEAVSILFEEIAPEFEDRDGGYTRIMRLAKPRLGDAGQRAVLELVGQHDRVAEKSQKPSFADESPAEEDDSDAVATETAEEEPQAAAEEEVVAEEDTAGEEE